MAIKINQVTRVLSPVKRDIRDSLEKVCKIDKYEIKDEDNIVIGWSIPFSEMDLQTFQQKISVNRYKWMAKSTTKTDDFTYLIFTYCFEPKSILIRVTSFLDHFTVEVL